MQPTNTRAQRPPCAWPPDCPYAGRLGTCPHTDYRKPAEMHDLWRYCFGDAAADRLLAEWIDSTEQSLAECERAKTSRWRDLLDWGERAEQCRRQLANLRAVLLAEERAA